MSIFHKITGIGMYAGLFALVSWLACVAGGKESYYIFSYIANSVVGRIFLIGWTWAFFYHFGCGIRHLLWAAGKCLSLDCVYKTGYVALAFSAIATISLWAVILGNWI
jgi:succinate dehydrogenase / fumarate reductase cytochrome b subunit